VRQQTSDANLAELGFTAGLLHDVGKLILLDRMTDSYRVVCQKAKNTPATLRQIERAEYNVDHADVGGYLLGIWGLPAPLVEAVFYHHEPQNSLDSEFSALTAVHVANIFAQEKVPGQPSPDLGLLDAAYLARLNLLDRVKEWPTEVVI
jgi:HD-like signal output (HDOD) protein